MRVSAAGLAVTPEGSPLRVTATGLEKPLIALAVTEIGPPVAPAVRLNDAGEAARVKSPAGAALAMVRVTLVEWLRVPEIPVKVSVALPAVALEAAVMVTFWAVPGVSVKAAGAAVTPTGSPVRATATVPEKPLTALAVTLIGIPAAPAVRLRDAGDAVSVKSGLAEAATMVRATSAEWLREPDVPDKVSIALPAEADEEAVMVTCWIVPGVRVSVAGVAVTPAGSPVRVTATGLEKPLTALAETFIGIPAAPAVRVSKAGAAVSVKSGVGAEAAVMAAETVVEWLNAPDVPEKVMVASPAAAEEAAKRVTVWAVPGVRVRVAGCAVTPLGRPVMVTATLEVKPFSGAAFTLMV